MHSLLEHFEEVAKKQHDRLAIISGDQQLTYEDLWSSARKVSEKLRALGVLPGHRVALLGDRGVEDFVALLGIWLAHAAYVPLSHQFPAERNKKIILDAHARWILIGKHSCKEAQECLEHAQRIESFDADGLEIFYANTSLPQDETSQSMQGTLAYLIYTSGTTGDPKGVPITHENLNSYLSNIQSLYPLNAEDKVAQLAQLSFDASVHEFGTSWNCGATLCVVPTRASLMWPRYFQELRVSVALLIPSAINQAQRAGLLRESSLKDLRLAFLGAEAVTKTVVEQIHAANPAAQLINLWGPTETTVFFTHYPINPKVLEFEVTPIGLPLSNQRACLVDNELLQNGDQVFQGYWRQPELSQEKFVTIDGEHWYKSGDMARLDPAHGFIYLGRLDRQVKLSGYRVELQAVESAVRDVSGIQELAVVPLRGSRDKNATALICYFVGSAPLGIEQIKERLGKKIAPYMIPKEFIQMPYLPLGSTGKTDFRALEELTKSSWAYGK